MTTKKAKPSATPSASKQQVCVYLSPEARGVLQDILDRDGVPFSAQVERAVRLWAIEKGIEVAHDRRKATS